MPGKHVLVEKPIALNFDDAAEIVAEARYPAAILPASLSPVTVAGSEERPVPHGGGNGPASLAFAPASLTTAIPQGMWTRFFPAVRHARKLIADGAIGDVKAPSPCLPCMRTA